MPSRSGPRILLRTVVLVAAVVLLVQGDLGPVMTALAWLVVVVEVVGLARDLLGRRTAAPAAEAGAGVVVRVDAPGERPVKVVRSVRQHTGLGLVEVKTGLDRLPARFETASLDLAEQLRQDLVAQGASAVVEPPSPDPGR